MDARVRVSRSLRNAQNEDLVAAFPQRGSAPSRIPPPSFVASMGLKRRYEMLDFAPGITWFLSGLGATVILTALLVMTVLFARWTEHR